MLLRFSSTPEQARKERFGSSELNVCPPNPANQNGRFGPLDADFAAAMNADWSITGTFATRHPLVHVVLVTLTMHEVISALFIVCTSPGDAINVNANDECQACARQAQRMLPSLSPIAESAYHPFSP